MTSMTVNKLSFLKKASIITIGLAVAVFGVFTVYAASQVSREYHLKGAFLRYVAQFVEWPADSIPESAVNICVYGEIPALKGINSINGRIVNDRSIVIRTIPKYDIAKKECQILYISKYAKDDLDALIADMKGLPVLTFGDMDGFAEKGGAMNFHVVNNRMANVINQQTINDSKLKISPRMLKLVTVVPNIDG